MAHAYTPGLMITGSMAISKLRRLPIAGTVLVEEGQSVTAETPIARTELPGDVVIVNAANALSCQPVELRKFMDKSEGDPVAKGEVIAETKGLFGLFKSSVKATETGTIESISDVTGQVLIRKPPVPLEVNAYIDGTIAEVIPNEGAIVETKGAMIQGIFGIGGENIGRLKVMVDDPDEPLTTDLISEDDGGRIIVGGSLVTADALRRAQQVGAKGVIVGGIDAGELKSFLGYEIGVAITGSEEIGLTVIITEGFGRIRMSDRAFGLLKELDGKKASMNGATQIRAGVLRPEVIVAIQGMEEIKTEKNPVLEVGSKVRIIRGPEFGKIGQVVSLPPEPQKIETESAVRVLEVAFDDGSSSVLPRANVEIIGE